ncbi:MAG: methyl-accepting chemotaxis protein [Pseudomonadota bacterium]
MGDQNDKRRIILIDTKFQYRFIRNISILAILIVAASLSVLAIISFIYGDVQVKIAQPLPFPMKETLGFEGKQTTLFGIFWPTMLICIIATLAVTFIFGIFVSHRMAGPIFRIERVLGEMAEGDLRGEICLRKKDEFKPLAFSVNILKRQWREPIRELKEIYRQLECNGDPKQKRLLGRL